MNTLLVGLTLTVGAPALRERPGETAIVGDWVLVEWLQGGQPTEFPDGSGVEFLPGGKRVWRDGPGQTDERTYKLYPKTQPAAIDLIRTENGPVPVVHPCIFKIEADRLVIAVGPPGGGRPTGFDAADLKMLMTFKRARKRD